MKKKIGENVEKSKKMPDENLTSIQCAMEKMKRRKCDHKFLIRPLKFYMGSEITY